MEELGIYNGAVKRAKTLTRIELSILELLKKHPEGLDIAEIRDLLHLGTTQAQLGRRLRDLDPLYVIEREEGATVPVQVREAPQGG